MALARWKIMRFLLNPSGRFSLIATFSWSNWEQYLLELIVWFISVENHMQKYGQSFFRLTYMEPKHQSDSHNQAGANDFQCLIWIL